VRRAALLPPLTILAIAAAILSIATARELTLGERAIASADAAIARLDWREAIAQARTAAQTALPLSPWPERGAARLESIASAAEARGDVTTALLAYGALRSAALATRSPTVAHDLWRARADAGLARAATFLRGVTSAHEPDDPGLELRPNDGPGGRAFAAIALASWCLLAGILALASGAAGARAGRVLAAVGFVAYAIALLLN
jgi:hypothetical protein